MRSVIRYTDVLFYLSTKLRTRLIAIVEEESGLAENPFLGDELWKEGFSFKFGAQKWHALI